VPQPLLVAELSKLGGVKDQIFVQQTANSIALMARKLGKFNLKRAKFIITICL